MASKVVGGIGDGVDGECGHVMEEGRRCSKVRWLKGNDVKGVLKMFHEGN